MEDAGSLPVDAGVPLSVRFVTREDGGLATVSSLLYSLPFAIRVEGAPPLGKVTLLTRVQRLTASAVFRASPDGVVDTGTDGRVGVTLVLGGTTEGRGRASRQFDDAWRAFLRSSFGR